MQTINIKVKDLVEGYTCNADDTEANVACLNGKLTLRPQYQRAFVYDEAKQGAVIDTILMDCPLGVVYFVENQDGTLECLDGQQRLTSICEYVKNKTFVPVGKKNCIISFDNLEESERKAILDYDKIIVYVLSGEEATRRIAWFERINAGGVPLTNQEMLNALFNGPFINALKAKFSSKQSIKSGIWQTYSKVVKFTSDEVLRQKGVEMAIKMCDSKSDSCEDILGKNRSNGDISFVTERLTRILEWAKRICAKIDPNVKEIKLNEKWEALYDTYGQECYNPELIGEKFKELMADEEVTNKKGIIYYLLDPDKYENKLSIRAFSESDKKTVYAKQNGICPKCGKHFEYSEMAGDHIIPWVKGGKTTIDNLQMLCAHCNGVKSNN